MPSSFQLSTMKLFDDTTANPSSNSERIVSGNNRLFMTYSDGKPVNGNQSTTQLQILVSSNDGELIRHTSLPFGFILINIINLNDGTFAVVASPPYLSNFLSAFHFDENGNLIAHDSISLPLNSYMGTVSKSHNNNLLVCSYDNSTNGAYLFESKENGQILWSKSFSRNWYAIANSNDGGYLLLENGIDSSFSVLKINATGDSLWSHKYSLPFTSVTYNMVQLGNGTYRICVNDLDSWGYNPNTPSPLYVYDINSNGDFLGLKTIFETNYSFSGSIMKLDDTHSFSLITVPFNMLGAGRPTILSKTNSHFLILDTSQQITSHGSFQNETTDLIDASCNTSNNQVACFGLMQGVGRTYFKPTLFIMQ